MRLHWKQENISELKITFVSGFLFCLYKMNKNLKEIIKECVVQIMCWLMLVRWHLR